MEATKLVREERRKEREEEVGTVVEGGRRREGEVGVVVEGGSPTAEFLLEMKEKMEVLSKEQMEIEDQFEDYNQTSLQE